MTQPAAATGPRRQQKEERREQILDAALRVFSEKGFAGASIRDIAREVGVTEGLLYHYFESKEQLMHACWKERSWRAHLEKILEESGGVAIAEVLRNLIGDFLNTLREHAPLVRMCSSEMQRNPEMAEYQRGRIADNAALIGEFLRQRQAAGEIRPDIDVNTPGSLLMGCAYSLFVMWGDSGDEEWQRSVEAIVENGVDVVMNGIRPASA
jgi:AcrR family transcriptional regulator